MLNIIQRPVAPGNWRVGRSGHKPEAIVIHVSTSTAASCDAWFANPKAKVSAHYLVRKDGAIHGYVKVADTAYHAGTVVNPTWPRALKINPNLVTIGIEHEGKVTDIPPESQYAASAELIFALCQRWAISIDENHIVPHSAIRANKYCPGKVNVGELILRAGAIVAATSKPVT